MTAMGKEHGATQTPMQARDAHWMRQAVALSRDSLYLTSPTRA